MELSSSVHEVADLLRDVVAFIPPSNRTRWTVRVTTVHSHSRHCVTNATGLQSTNATSCTVARMDSQSTDDASSCALALLPFCGLASHLLIIREVNSMPECRIGGRNPVPFNDWVIQ